MKRPARRLALVAPNRRVADRFRGRPGVRVFDSPARVVIDRWNDVIVLVSWRDLDAVAALIRSANERGCLRCVLLEIENDQQRDLLPALLNHVRVRSLRNLFVHNGPELPNRVVNAFRIGAEEELIAEAATLGDELFVVSCSGSAYRLRFDDILQIRKLTERERAAFRVAVDGGHIAWSDNDIHLDLDAIRCIADEDYRLQSQYRALLRWRRFGSAVAQLRRAHDLRQSDFGDLSERQVRRIEHGESGSLESIRRLAAGHGMSVTRYLEVLASMASAPPLRVSDAGAGN